MKIEQKDLVALLLAILAFKFVVIPVLDWQDEKNSQLQAIEKRVQKAEQYINNIPVLIENEKLLVDSLQEMKASVDTYQSANEYQLSKQKKIEGLFKKHNLSVNTLNWQDSAENNGTLQLRLMMQYRGKIKDFIAFHMDVSNQNNSFEVVNLGLNIRGQKPGTLGIFDGNIVFIFTAVEAKDVNV